MNFLLHLHGFGIHPHQRGVEHLRFPHVPKLMAFRIICQRLPVTGDNLRSRFYRPGILGPGGLLFPEAGQINAVNPSGPGIVAPALIGRHHPSGLPVRRNGNALRVRNLRVQQRPELHGRPGNGIQFLAVGISVSVPGHGFVGVIHRVVYRGIVGLKRHPALLNHFGAIGLAAGE